MLGKDMKKIKKKKKQHPNQTSRNGNHKCLR